MSIIHDRLLALSVAPDVQRTHVRTHRAKKHETGEGHDPEVHRVDNVAAIELLEEPALDTWISDRNIKQRADQKAITQPIDRDKHDI